jgi:Apea-like HEPN
MISFHSAAQASFSASAEELLREVKAYAAVGQCADKGKGFDIHPVAVIGPEEMIGIPRLTQSQVDGTGNETGRFWSSSGQCVGWAGDAFQKMKHLAEEIATSKELHGLVSEAFILDQIFAWLCQTLDRKCSDPISDFISKRCEDAITDHEIYVPLCGTYSSVDFRIGNVDFKSITKELLDGWFPSKPMGNPEMEKRVRQLEHDTRAKFQASLAACVRVRAEDKKASQVALEKSLTATALLRFLSAANWTPKIKSYTLPLGMENSATWHSFHLVNGTITSLSSTVISEGPHEWVVDEARARMSGVIELLSDLSEGEKTDFRKTIFDAMLIYSRNSTTTDPADKLVFVLVALESVLLKDSSEPIQGNLGERMAFLIGTSLPERQEIVRTVKKIYAMRSKFIHHGQSIDDLEVFDRFLLYAWSSFLRLLNLRDHFKTRMDLLAKLDEMKLS